MTDLHESGQTDIEITEEMRWVVRDWLGAEPSGGHVCSDREIDGLLVAILKVAVCDRRQDIPQPG